MCAGYTLCIIPIDSRSSMETWTLFTSVADNTHDYMLTIHDYLSQLVKSNNSHNTVLSHNDCPASLHQWTLQSSPPLSAGDQGGALHRMWGPRGPWPNVQVWPGVCDVHQKPARVPRGAHEHPLCLYVILLKMSCYKNTEKYVMLNRKYTTLPNNHISTNIFRLEIFV